MLVSSPFSFLFVLNRCAKWPNKTEYLAKRYRCALHTRSSVASIRAESISTILDGIRTLYSSAVERIGKRESFSNNYHRKNKKCSFENLTIIFSIQQPGLHFKAYVEVSRNFGISALSKLVHAYSSVCFLLPYSLFHEQG